MCSSDCPKRSLTAYRKLEREFFDLRDQLAENLGALEVELSDDQLGRLNEASSISPGFPHDMLQPQVEGLKRRIDNHRAATTPEW